MSGKHPCDEGVILDPALRGERCAHPGWILAATVLGSSMAFIDGTVVNIALPTLQTELNASVSGAQWIIEAYVLFLASLVLVGGALGDRYGRRRVFMLGTALFAIASVGCGMAQSVTQLVVGRSLQGVAGALLVPGSLAIIGASFPRADRGRAIGIWSGFSAISAGLGLVLGGWILQIASWPVLFFLNVPLAAVTLGITAWAVPESRDEHQQGPLDIAGALLVTMGLGLVAFGLIEGPAAGWASPEVRGALLAGTLFIGAFLLHQSRTMHPMLPLHLFRIPAFAGANLMTFFLYAALAGSMFFFPLNLIQVQGYSPSQAGAASLPFILLIFFVSRWAGGLTERTGPRLPLVAGPLITGVGFLLFSVPGVGGSYWTTFFPAVVVMGLGMAVSIAPLTTTVMGAVDESRAGLASGVNNAVSRVGTALAIAAFGPLILFTFTGSLEARLDDLGIQGEARAAVLRQGALLGAAQAPAALDTEVRMSVDAALDRAFVDGYRVVNHATAVLALLAALAAAGLIRRE